MRSTGSNGFIDHDAQIEDLVMEVRRGLRDLRNYAERTDRTLDLGAISVDTRWTKDARLISVSVTGDLQGDTPITPEAHEFTEDVNDASMCVCGVPALTHDQVYPPEGTGA